MPSAVPGCSWGRLERLCLQTQILSSACFPYSFEFLSKMEFVYIWEGPWLQNIFVLSGFIRLLSITWRDVLPARQLCSLVDSFLYWEWVSLGILKDSKHCREILGKKKDLGTWTLAPYSDHHFSSQSPWLPKISSSRDLWTSHTYASCVSRQFSFISLIPIASLFIFTGHLA